jgi:putative membrane protein
MNRTAALAAALLLIVPPAALADGPRAEPHRWWLAWNADPLVLLSLGVLAWLYGRGLRRLWRKLGGGRAVRRGQAAAFYGSLGVLAIALLSPIDSMSEELSSMHMVQHMLLMTAAAPLFVIGSPTLVLAWGMPAWQEGESHPAFTFAFRLPQTPILWHPLFLCGLSATTLWAWHHPIPYQAALRDPLVHDAQHVSFFVVACLFWRACLGTGGARRMSPAVAVPYLFSMSVLASALGVFLALSPRPWYDDYTNRTPAWGLTPLEDQQLAGLIMWMPACLIYPAIAAILFGNWLAHLERRAISCDRK